MFGDARVPDSRVGAITGDPPAGDSGIAIAVFDITALKQLKRLPDSHYQADFGWLIGFMRASPEGCFTADGDEALTVGVSVARKGWGPALYDFALAVAKEDGYAGLTSDRASVSPTAVALWRRYAESRPDVHSVEITECDLYEKPSNQLLNRAYYLPQFPPELSAMHHRGRVAVERAAERWNADDDEAVHAIFMAGNGFFTRYYNAPGGERPQSLFGVHR